MPRHDPHLFFLNASSIQQEKKRQSLPSSSSITAVASPRSKKLHAFNANARPSGEMLALTGDSFHSVNLFDLHALHLKAWQQVHRERNKYDAVSFLPRSRNESETFVFSYAKLFSLFYFDMFDNFCCFTFKDKHNFVQVIRHAMNASLFCVAIFDLEL
jgi:hypothetical protein